MSGEIAYTRIEDYGDEEWSKLSFSQKIGAARRASAHERTQKILDECLRMSVANIGISFDKYQMKTHETAVFPESMAVAYTAMGLGGEAGEVLNKVKKIYRDGNGNPSIESIKSIGKEIGGVLWYCSELASSLGLRLADIAEENLAELAGRKQRGTIKGSGDDR